MRANEYIARFIGTIDRLDQEGIKVPGLILSHAGFGKTSTVQKYCDCMDYNLVTLIPSMFSSDDILGLQSVQNEKLVRLTPSWFNGLKKMVEENHKRTILFVDEITTCDPYIQGPLLDLIFNGNLGEEHLPENVFIIAAGNYADDLNNVFKMSAPLVNRFVLLNLKNDDFDITELLSNRFDNLTDREDIEEYLGIIPSRRPTYDYNEFVRWIGESGEIKFGSTNYIEDEAYGLLGFTSIRSISHSLKFARMYMKTYNDDIWMRVVGDTLGMSNCRNEKPISLLLPSYANRFKVKIQRPVVTTNIPGEPKMVTSNANASTLVDIQTMLNKKGITPAVIESLDNYIDNMDLDSMQSNALELLSTLISENVTKSREMRKLHNKLTEKLENWD